MAGYCSRCGGALPDGVSVCPTCGAAVGSDAIQPNATGYATGPSAAAAGPEAGYNAPAPPRPGAYAGSTTYPPQKPSSPMKIVLIVIGVVLGLGIISAAVLGFFGWRAMHQAGNSFSIGHSANVTESDLGVPIYPNATAKPGAAMRASVGGNVVASATFLTDDSESAVLDFYRGKLPGNVVEGSSHTGTSLSATTDTGDTKDSIVVTVGPAAESDHGTRLTILHSRSVMHKP